MSVVVTNRFLFRESIVLEPGVTSIPHNRQQPRTSVATFECPEVAESAQKRLLHDIFSISVVAREPTSKVICCIEMRQDSFFKYWN
jgi:hypothetical protein